MAPHASVLGAATTTEAAAAAADLAAAHTSHYDPVAAFGRSLSENPKAAGAVLIAFIVVWGLIAIGLFSCCVMALAQYRRTKEVKAALAKGREQGLEKGAEAERRREKERQDALKEQGSAEATEDTAQRSTDTAAATSAAASSSSSAPAAAAAAPPTQPAPAAQRSIPRRVLVGQGVASSPMTPPPSY